MNDQIEGGEGGSLYEMLFRAYFDARKNKRSKPDVLHFEQNLLQNIIDLEKEIRNKTYEPIGGIVFITSKPVIREIFAGNFRDRVIHHLLFNLTNDWWERRLFDGSYSCRKGRGVLFGVRKLQAHIRSVNQNNAREAWVAKFDIQGCFMSFDREKLLKLAVWGARRQFGEKRWLCGVACFLWEKVLLDDPTSKVRRRGNFSQWYEKLPKSKSLFNQPKGRGVVIGNLTSQLISNIFLDQLDRFMKIELKVKHYGRYVDDFFIVDEKKESLLELLPKIEKYVSEELGLVLHPRKRLIINAKVWRAVFGRGCARWKSDSR